MNMLIYREGGSTQNMVGMWYGENVVWWAYIWLELIMENWNEGGRNPPVWVMAQPEDPG